jgi:hypothetical protein
LKGRGFSGAEIIDPQNNLSFRALRSRAAARWARNPLSADTTTAHVKWKDRVERTLLSVAFDVDLALDLARAALDLARVERTILSVAVDLVLALDLALISIPPLDTNRDNTVEERRFSAA